ncbi:MAG: TetR/AcrR family transcriptional regulator [Gammaproteobacteria bacterium]|nr:TetR/AcrR family transcriptional regulator [Gammaproteobacteria bacterium]
MKKEADTNSERRPDNNSATRATGKKGQKRRQQIIDVAKELLISDGPVSLVLRDVADRLGITHGNLQYYFPTKNDLLLAIFDQEVEKYTVGMKAAVSATSTRQGRLDAIIDSGIAELKTAETALWRMMMSLASHNAEMANILKKENDLYECMVADELQVIAPGLSSKRRAHIARIIHALLDGLGIQFTYENPNGPEMRALASEIKVALFTILEKESV